MVYLVELIRGSAMGSDTFWYDSTNTKGKNTKQ